MSKSFYQSGGSRNFRKADDLAGLPGTRELVVPRTPYIAAYAVAADTVRILRIIHGAQIWPDEIRPGEPR